MSSESSSIPMSACCQGGFVLLLLLLVAKVKSFLNPNHCHFKKGDICCYLKANNDDDDVDCRHGVVNNKVTLPMNRRRVLGHAASALLFSGPAQSSWADTEMIGQQEKEATASKPVVAATMAPITHKVLMNVRISRQDGTFFIRDDLDESKPENKVFYGELVMRLFGTVAPKCVEEFLKYVQVRYDPLEENPLPTYARSTFVRFDQSTGLLTGGLIPSLEVTEFGGSNAIKYGGRVLPAPLWIDTKSSNGTPLGHDTIGLLTHRSLEIAPLFGITTRAAPELDGAYTVFGQLLLDESSRAFLDIVQGLPTYSNGPPPSSDEDSSQSSSIVNGLKSAVFSSQRDFMRTAAKSLGDSRVSKIYEGKILRRIEVTKTTMLPI